MWQQITSRTPPDHPLSLPELIDMALANSPSTRKVWNEAKAASAQVSYAEGYFMPSITGVADAERRKVNANPANFDTDYLRLAPGLQLNYLIINFGGGRQAAVEQALHSVYASNFSFNKSIQEAVLSVELAYYGLIAAEAGVTAADANLKDATTALDAARTRRDAGAGVELEVLQAQAACDQAFYAKTDAIGRLKSAQGNLAKSLALPADSHIPIQAITNTVPKPLLINDMHAMIEAAISRRPDIAALRSTLASRLAAIRVTKAANRPSLYLNGSASRDSYDTYGGKEFQSDDWSAAATLSLRWLLFDGLQTRSSLRTSTAQAEAARYQLEQAEIAVAADVWTRYYAYDTALQKHHASVAFLKSAASAYDMALQSYAAGLRSLLDLLDAENKLAQARRQLTESRQEVFTALSYLAYATGMLTENGSANCTAELAP